MFPIVFQILRQWLTTASLSRIYLSILQMSTGFFPAKENQNYVYMILKCSHQEKATILEYIYIQTLASKNYALNVF